MLYIYDFGYEFTDFYYFRKLSIDGIQNYIFLYLVGHPFTFLLFEISFFSIRPYLDYDKNLEYKQTLFFKKKAWKILKNDIIWRF